METAITGRAPSQKKKRGFFSFYSRGEEIFNAVSHIVGGGFGVVAWITLLILSHGAVEYVAATLFGMGIVTLYTMSALYHFLPDGRAKGVFRIFDHCTIFLLIAGTYSPVCLVAFYGTPVGWGVFAAEWAIAAAGITMNAIAMNNKAVKGISMALYCVGGWLGLVFFHQLVAAVSVACFAFLLAGGLTYTAGIAFYAFGRKKRWFHAVWHLFVLLGTVLQFVSILLMYL